MNPIPAHLAGFDWYAPLQAYLRSIGLTPRHDPGDAAPLRADLRDADLRRAVLLGADLSGADLTGADLSGANLSRAYLRGADLSRAYLRGADLRRADLSGADLSGTAGLPAAPVIPDIDAAILAAIEADGCSLAMREWHTCGTTHCRAGWAIHLAGEAGAALEEQLGPSVAGALIYTASRPDQPVPDWFASDAQALADLRRCAGGAE